MRRIYAGYREYAEARLALGPNPRAMLYKNLAPVGMSAFEPGARVAWFRLPTSPAGRGMAPSILSSRS
ncbi:MAG: hypothetical protein PVG99_06390 [Desulfobacteraceae bacterium]|jgi:hypothetical protein